MPKAPPKLTVVSTTAARFAPPPGLGEAGAKLWQDINAEYMIDDSGGREMLLQICTAADRGSEYAEAIGRNGAVTYTKAGPKDHPLLKHELAARSFIVRSLHRLGLDVEPTRTSVGRPPGYSKPRMR